MQCPIDGTQLVMTDRNGVEIDYCPSCRGVWLDRGELDKIIERSMAQAAPPPPPQPAQRPARGYDEDYEDRRRYKKRDSFLSDLFDF
ncbi:MAG: zf-TFIIB domain-containing protein [Rhodobacteraceae bacterium]|jgi:Zn-finger nucleic acid-binding protein|nr:zf-TFIIB domain-containing protein [Paracoccaceae bacterium]